MNIVENQEPITIGVEMVTLIGTTVGRGVVLGTALSAGVLSVVHKNRAAV